MSTTTNEQITQARARLAGMRERLGEEAVTHRQEDDSLLLRLVAHAEDVLDRHAPSNETVWCKYDGDAYPCTEVEAVIKAWTP